MRLRNHVGDCQRREQTTALQIRGNNAVDRLRRQQARREAQRNHRNRNRVINPLHDFDLQLLRLRATYQQRQNKTSKAYDHRRKSSGLKTS